ncbi:MAG: DUF2142 domain-containing protein [Chloroflexi bacterium]|nr:MAG: hypothetical protein CUN54_05050 [Phototrophicales bacterium]RMF81974.1 MAG: DUF2142 domain-containing protein [Chloroflexota bacterium]
MTQFSTTKLRNLIAVGYVIIALIYSIASPIFEVSDELWHYPMVDYLANNGLRLPMQDANNIGLWRQEGSQPPLYYMAVAILTAAIDTSDLEYVRRQNPHADIGIVRPDGNANMIVHRVEAEAFPWSGTVLAVHIVRLFSIVLGLGTILVTYHLARELFPDNPTIALGAMALNAFLPMFLFISASVNNDALSNLIGNLLTLLLVKLLKSERLPTTRTYLVIGIVTGIGLLAKLNIGFLVPLIALALLILSLRFRNWRPVIIGGVVSGGLTIAIAGWWYWRNLQLYDDVTGLNRFLDIVGRRLIPANAAQLWSERDSFLQAYWGFFGGMNVPLPDAVYLVFNLIGGLTLLSAIVFLASRIYKRDWSRRRWLYTSATIIWPVVTFISFLRWTMITPASQGRLIFGALSSISLWMAVGLVWWLPKYWQRIATGSVAGYFAAVAILAPFLVIAPAYKQPPDIQVQAAAQTSFSANDGGAIDLLDANVLTKVARPEAFVELTADWVVAQSLQRDWSMFIHLTTPDGVIISQRDVYPGQGTLATSDLSPGKAWHNPLAIWVPSNAYAPMTLDVNLGWYHLPTGERLQLPNGSDVLTIGQVELHPRASSFDVPNPISVIFDNQIELLGYQLSDLSPKPGETTELTLYWRGLKDIADDYVVFVHIIEPQTNTIYAGSDAQPAQWTAPTSEWELGDVVEDTHSLEVRADAVPGIYELEIGLYLPQPDGTFPRLRVVTQDGGQANDFTYLSRIRILPSD